MILFPAASVQGSDAMRVKIGLKKSNASQWPRKDLSSVILVGSCSVRMALVAVGDTTSLQD